MVERPATLEIDEALTRAVTAAEPPGVFGVDSIRSRVEIALVGGARIVGGVDDRIGSWAVDIRVVDDLEGPEPLGERLEVGGRRRLHPKVAEEVAGLVARVHLARAVHERLQLALLDRGEQGMKGEPRELTFELFPLAREDLLEVALGVLTVGQRNGFDEADDHLAFEGAVDGSLPRATPTRSCSFRGRGLLARSCLPCCHLSPPSDRQGRVWPRSC